MSASSLPMWLLREAFDGSDPTSSELAALKRIALGDTQIEAAERLGKSPETVRKQMKMVRARLRARTNAHAVAIAMSRDLI